jgi:uncharacterized protein YbjT (DUF2867 family)
VKVLLVGSSGFIGRRLHAALLRAGHEVASTTRHPSSARDAGTVTADYTRDIEAQMWVPRLAGIDVVINAVGILRESGSQTFKSIHTLAPQALFAACAATGVTRVIQLSALGADAHASSRYHLSKRRADDFLAKLPLKWTVVQPSLVFGAEGASTQMLCALASLPLIPVPGRGDQNLQPVHIEDLAEGIVRLVSEQVAVREIIPFVGSQAVTLADYLQLLRAELQLPRARLLSVPLSLVRFGARIAGLLPTSPLDPDSLGMLLRGNTADAAPFTKLLGHPPRSPRQFIGPGDAKTLRVAAQVKALAPLLRFSIALVWLITGVVSLGLYPVPDSYELLARVGIPAALAPVMLYGAAALDILFGLGTLFMRRRRWLYLAQIGVIVLYTAIITVKLPEFWLHPFGPLLKNLPMLAGILLLQQLERR